MATAEPQRSSKKPAVSSFFAGIGGFDLGFERAGFEPVFQCEINEFCNKILAKHWPDVPRKRDIREVIHATDIPFSNVWTGGFPCQDVSLARMGPRMGLKGSKSGLFYEFARLLGEGRPRVVVIENVPGLLSSHDGEDFRIVIQTLAELGYGVGWRVLNSKNFGVPQSRQRVFIVGCYGDPTGPANILFEPQRSSRDNSQNGQDGKKPLSSAKKGAGAPRKGPVVPEIAYCLYACSARHTGTDWSRNYASYPDGRVRRFTPVECEPLQGFPVDWTLLESVKNIDKSDSMRYQAIGNAVSVPVIEWIAKRVKAYLASQQSAPAIQLPAPSRRILREPVAA